jgi:[ribosomal protein S18]-alanine N-acetyltransferase
MASISASVHRSGGLAYQKGCARKKSNGSSARIIHNMPVIRRGEPADLPEVAAIQAASPQAPQWKVADYLQYDLLVAICETQVRGFLAFRTPVASEREILNLAVAPGSRRRGIARALWRSLLQGFTGTIYLEVRETNQAARNLYHSLGFQEISRRPRYYSFPPEAAIVMKFHSC